MGKISSALLSAYREAEKANVPSDSLRSNLKAKVGLRRGIGGDNLPETASALIREDAIIHYKKVDGSQISGAEKEKGVYAYVNAFLLNEEGEATKIVELTCGSFYKMGWETLPELGACRKAEGSIWVDPGKGDPIAHGRDGKELLLAILADTPAEIKNLETLWVKYGTPDEERLQEIIGKVITWDSKPIYRLRFGRKRETAAYSDLYQDWCRFFTSSQDIEPEE